MTEVLLLNATYEPLCVVSTRRALVLVLADKVDIVLQDDERVVRSVHLEVPVPSVVRLRAFVRVPYRTRSAVTRRGVLRRDAYRCAYCRDRKATTVDHVIPTSRGGPNTWENVVAACEPCNSRKGDRLVRELGWQPRFEPTVPLVTRRIVLAAVSVDPTWEPWLVLDRSAGAVAAPAEDRHLATAS